MHTITPDQARLLSTLDRTAWTITYPEDQPVVAQLARRGLLKARNPDGTPEGEARFTARGATLQAHKTPCQP